MAARSRIRRVVKWIGSCVSLLLATLWLLSVPALGSEATWMEYEFRSGAFGLAEGTAYWSYPTVSDEELCG